MMDEEMQEEVELTMGHARHCLDAARYLLGGEYYPDAINRAYYCVFHCARALLLNDDSVEFKKHSSVIGSFRKNFVKTGIFEPRLSDIIGDLFKDRSGCDYDDRFTITVDTVESKVNDAEFFYNKVYEYLNISA